MELVTHVRRASERSVRRHQGSPDLSDSRKLLPSWIGGKRKEIVLPRGMPFSGSWPHGEEMTNSIGPAQDRECGEEYLAFHFYPPGSS